MVNISFDFDGTIGHHLHLQILAQHLCVDPNNTVHIITRRYNYLHPTAGDEMSQVLALAEKVGIKKENIHFTNRVYKVAKIKELDIDMHYDDDQTELQFIRQHFPKCKAFLVL